MVFEGGGPRYFAGFVDYRMLPARRKTLLHKLNCNKAVSALEVTGGVCLLHSNTLGLMENLEVALDNAVSELLG